MDDRMDMLERTILDLGAEVYKLRHVMVGMTLKNQALSKLLDGLKSMLDEKGLVSSEEVEEAALLNGLVDHSRLSEIEADDGHDRLINDEDSNH